MKNHWWRDFICKTWSLQIYLTIRNQYPHSVCILQDVQNMIKKIKRKMYGDRTPMQILESMLQEERYVCFTRVNPSTNAVEEVFFVHPDSYNMWRAFPHVLMIDATYKTNEYKLSFIQVMGVTSTHKSFCVAHAFVSKEKKDNFLWVLEKLKELLVDCMEPRVIVTDRDQAFMNACDKVFPKASKLLCRWHISQNILKHCREKFTDEDWKIFKLSWSRLCNSPIPTIYNYNFQRLFMRLVNDGRSDVLDYLYDVWLKDYKEKFVLAWTNTVPNFGQHTTNRVESQHSKFKRYIKGPNNSLHRLVCLVGKVVESQKIQIKVSFEKSRSVQIGDHRFLFFDNLRGNVSQKALELMVVERKKLNALRAGGGTCQMEWWENTGCKIPLAAIDKFWTKLDFSTEKLNQDECNIQAEMDKLTQQLHTQPPLVLKSMLSKMKAVLNPSMTDHQPPEVQQDTWGRPTTKAKQ
ncbi:putative MULE transposase domain, FHY3/FAR1 family [Helianthus annuus]|nr:putative MULE transposase domain, FHY3/FAR1 family [Helianthus annuus]